MWAVMKAFPWESISSSHIKMVTPPEGAGQPQFFIPVFNKIDDAAKFAGKEAHLIIEVLGEKP